ncbi:MAG: PstS family phosphate ABC transporter substrate-binding protein [Xenococcaceae cyanobacterium MO_188.B29]|nr:PstS family phosphate ABC transporter substrate-binding protein [Xenococcaceae cyanobacterium MO_188.B29]
MQLKQDSWKILTGVASVAAVLALAVPVVKSQGRTLIKIDGSSTVYPITEAVAEEFQIDKRGAVQVTVGISGTGGGFKKFCSQDASVRTDISNASRTIKDSEKEACKAAGVEYIELPVAYDAITVVVNQDNPIDSMTVEELKTMWQPEADETVTQWSQVNSSWPQEEFTLFGPGADSGTFDYFTDKITGEEGASRTDYTPSEDDNVLVQGVASDPFALGYFGYSYYESNRDKLKAVAIDDGTGNAVYPSLETVRNGDYKPLSRPIFIYINAEAAEKPEVKDFIEFYLANASELVPEVGSVPLDDSGYEEALARFQNKVLGTASAQ